MSPAAAWATSTSTFGAARRSSVGAIGASRSMRGARIHLDGQRRLEARRFLDRHVDERGATASMMSMYQTQS